MSHAAEAPLEAEGLSFSKRSAVIAAFGRRFTGTGGLHAELHRFLIEAQSIRRSGDYGERSPGGALTGGLFGGLP